MTLNVNDYERVAMASLVGRRRHSPAPRALFLSLHFACKYFFLLAGVSNIFRRTHSIVLLFFRAFELQITATDGKCRCAYMWHRCYWVALSFTLRVLILRVGVLLDSTIQSVFAHSFIGWNGWCVCAAGICGAYQAIVNKFYLPMIMLTNGCPCRNIPWILCNGYAPLGLLSKMMLMPQFVWNLAKK